MNLCLDFYDVNLNLEEIEIFFKLFSNTQDTIKFNIFNNLNQDRKKKKIEKSKLSVIDLIKSKINKKEINLVDKNDYKIIIKKNSVKSLFNEDFDDNIINLLYQHIAYHFGYTKCKCSGFTVKDKDNKKIQVEEIIYIKNVFQINIPENLVFVKTDKKLKSPESTNYEFKTDFITQSSILYSIFSCKEVHFKDENISYHLKRNESSYTLYCDMKRLTHFELINSNKENKIAEFLNKNPKEISRLLYTIYYNKDLSVLEPITKIKKMIEKDYEFIWSFLCVVPFFNDNRDFITEKLLEIYENINNNKQIKKRGEYLEIKERRYVDKMGFGSLKRYFYGLE